MSDLVNIQEEFESLISELERLKNVNELVTKNSESSNKVITEIESFIDKNNEYLNKANERVEKIEEEAEVLLDKLRKNLNEFNTKTDALDTILDRNFSELHEKREEQWNGLDQNLANISGAISSINKEVSEYPEHLSKISDKQHSSERNIKSIVQDKSDNLDEKFNQLETILKQQSEKADKLLNILFLAIGITVVGFIAMYFLIG